MAMTDLYGVSPCVISTSSGYTAYYAGTDSAGTPYSGISYATSADGLDWARVGSITLTGESNPYFNPWVFEASGKYQMVYEAQDSPGARRLFMASSADGVNFTKTGEAPILTDDTADLMGGNIFQSVAEGIDLGGGNMRLYFVSGGSTVASAVSTDYGATWTRDTDFRLANAVDPSAYQTASGDIRMVYTEWDATDYTNSTNRLLAVESTDDGDTFGPAFEIVYEVPDTATYNVYDPDVYTIGSDAYVMYSVTYDEDEADFTNSTLSRVSTDILPDSGAANTRIVPLGEDSVGTSSDDLMTGTYHNDTLSGGDGADTISGAEYDDIIHGNVGADILYGGDGEDSVFGDEDNDTLYGEDGGDGLSGGGGDDLISGGADNDFLQGQTGTDVLYGGDGNDTLAGNEEDDTLYGGANDDEMRGGRRNDWLSGEAGSDTLYGDGGRDTLDGGGDGDTLYGGNLGDYFYFGSSSGNDIIGDFNAAEDAIQIVSDVNGSGIYSTADVLARLSASGPTTVIDLDGGNTVTLLGIVPSDLTASNFMIV